MAYVILVEGKTADERKTFDRDLVAVPKPRPDGKPRRAPSGKSRGVGQLMALMGGANVPGRKG